MYLIDQQNLGGITSGGPDNVVDTFDIGGGCWCAPSYFTGADGVARVVSSGGLSVIVWKLSVDPTTTLTQESTTLPLTSGQDAGFFTSVSSNGMQDGTALIWAVSRPTDIATPGVSLLAFDPRDGSQVFSAPAGTWLSQGNANIVPVVANGQVFVASSQQLAILGLGAAPPVAAGTQVAPAAAGTAMTPVAGGPANRVSGTIVSVNGAALTVETREGRSVSIDAADAQQARQSVALFPGEAITASGAYDAQGTLRARSIVRAKPSRALWQPDQ